MHVDFDYALDQKEEQHEPISPRETTQEFSRTPAYQSEKAISTQGKNRYRFILPHFSNKNSCLSITSLLSIHTHSPHSLSDLRLSFGERVYRPDILARNRLRASNRFLVIIKIAVPVDDLRQMAIHNKVRAFFLENGKETAVRPITYDVLLRKYVAKHSPYLYDEKDDTVAFFRQNIGRSVTLTVRHKNVTDDARALWKLRLAWLCSKFALRYQPILFFEKNAGRYEESAKFSFQYAIDHRVAKSRRCRFVAPREICNDESISNCYREAMIPAHTFRHYFSFFCCRSFIGTEAMSHAIELRCQSLLVQRKLRSAKNKYAFLQHGVMYMVSLNSPQRTSFRKNNMPPNSYVVVSSTKEADHFIEYAGFDRADLIVSGLPKFDGSVQNPNADRIVIMPTWRIWEFNQIRSNPQDCGYVKMISRIIEGIPDSLKSKVVVCPHPLFNQATFGKHAPNDDNLSIDELLRNAKVFITDYSSAAYDAFYRGAAVIFYWEELQECMIHYGGETHLMLNSNNAFGQIAYNSDDIGHAVMDAYMNGQTLEDRRKYHDIVSFHDGKNTERCVQRLVELGFFDTER